MIFSRPVAYAVRALICLARVPEQTRLMAYEIAAQERIPASSLAKTLQQLARKGLLDSEKGRNGGFRLGRPAKRISLMDVIEAVEGPKPFEQSVLGYRDRDHCPLEKSFKAVRRTVLAYLRKTNLEEFSKVRPTKGTRRGAAKKRRARART